MTKHQSDSERRAQILRAARAVFVERGTMGDERITPFSQLAEGKAPYFSLVLIPGRQRAR